MRIAIVGAGKRCLYLMEVINKHEFQVISPVIVAVSDIDESAPGFIKAKEDHIFATRDYNDLFRMDNIDLIMELTGDLDIYNDIISKKSPHVRAIAHTTAMLFWELDNSAQRYVRKKQELDQARVLYDALINGPVLDNVMVISLDYKILDINDVYLKNLALRREEVIGKYCYEISHHHSEPCRGKEHPCPIDRVRTTAKPSTTTHIHLTKNGEKKFISMSCYPLIEKGKVTGVIEISKNVTREIEFEKNMMQQEKLVSIGRLSAGVAHEINNPLTTILTSAMLAQEDVAPGSEIHDELTTISNEALRCREIVKSLLDFARQSKAYTKMGNINDVIKESAILTRKQARFKNINLSLDLADNLPLLSIDKDKIEQVLINLTLNAIEATPEGGQIRMISSFLKDQDFVEVRVADTGEGIAPENLARIFDPFFTTKKTGTGLGLSITHGIVEQHGGTITAESRPGEGTQFTIILPLPTENEK